MELKILQPGEDITLPIEGFGFYFIAGDGPISIELYDGAEPQAAILEPGQGLHDSVDRFESFRVVNLHSAAQAPTIYIGPRKFIDNRNVGEVAVSSLPSMPNKTRLDQNIYTSYVGVSSAASKFSQAQLYNNEVGYEYHVRNVNISLAVQPTATSVHTLLIGRYNTALATIAASAKALHDSTVSVADAVRKDQASSAASLSAILRHGYIGGQGRNDVEYDQPETPIILKYGEGLLGRSGSTNIAVTGSFLFERIAV